MKQNIYWQMLNYALLIFLVILIPVYAHYYGWQNFLWLSDVGLFLTCLGLWFKVPLLLSMAAVGVMGFELIWCAGFFSELILQVHLITLSDYMFNPMYPRALRALSLFHIITPMIWFCYLRQFGYQTRALRFMIGLYWLILILTYFLTNPADNINWVFMPEILKLRAWGQAVWLIILAIGFPSLIFLPTHFIYQKYFKTNLGK